MRYVREFDGLRGLMAVWVLVGHWATAISFGFPRLPDNLGNTYAVDVFIVLSGFAIATLLGRKKEPYGRYILRRALRIFPVYWFYLAISVALAWLALDVWTNAEFGAMQSTRAEIANAALDNFWPNVLTHIPALQAITPSRLVPLGEFAFLGQAWSISLEWQFYLVAPFAVAALVASARDWRVAVATVGVLFALAIISKFMPTGFIGDYSDKFAIGIGTYYLLNWHASKPTPLLPSTVTAATALIIGLLFLMNVPSALPLSLWVLAVGAVLSPSWGPLGAVSKALTLRPVEALGKMSYSVYLAHMIPLTLTLLVLRNFGVEGGVVHAFILLACTLAGTLTLSIFSYNLVEVPFQSLGKKLSGRTNAAVQPVLCGVGD